MTRFFVLFSFVFFIAPFSVAAESLINTRASNAIVIDFETGAVLFEKNADQKMPTSSMSKVMTMYLVFEALKRGEMSLNDELLVSEKAWRKGGSKMFVEVDKYVKVEDLIRGVIIQSGNDATIVLAEGLAGSEDKFAERLNEKAAELGMTNSHFMNASGWPDPDHYSTARDLATLAYHLVKNFPEYYGYYSEKEFSYNNINQKNRNPLLYREIGADGIKTGHTEAGGFGLIGSGKFQGRRAIIVINGLTDNKGRAQESAKLLEWGLKRYENRKLFSADEVVEHASVTMGEEKSIPVSVEDDIVVTLPKADLKGLDVSAHFQEPLVAPIKKGQVIGELEINIPNVGIEKRTLYAADDVAELGFVSKTIEKAKTFIMEQL